jgi:hypothetical protein
MRWLRPIGVAILVLVAIPVALITGLWQLMRGGADTSPQELAAKLRRMADGRDHRSDWDELECVPLRDARLEAIRQEVLMIDLPLRSEGRLKLVELADRTEMLQLNG